MLTSEEFMAGAEVEPLGDKWGEPLWRFHNAATNLSIDVHAPDEAGARARALAKLPEILAERA